MLKKEHKERIDAIHEKARKQSVSNDFDPTTTGQENIALRIVRDYCETENPEHALTNARAWVEGIERKVREAERQRLKDLVRVRAGNFAMKLLE